MGLLTGIRTILTELIGATRQTVTRVSNFPSIYGPTRDVGHADYAFWDKARYGKARGLEISGLLIKPLCSKLSSWVLGEPPQFRLAIQTEDDAQRERIKDTQQQLDNWFHSKLPKTMSAYENSLIKADMYLVINPDLTVTVIPPHVVTPIVDDNDYSKVIGWRIDDVYPHPTTPAQRMTIREEFTADKRVRTVWINSNQVDKEEFPNLIGRNPMIHIPNNVNADELFGRPEAEAILPMLHKYGHVFEAAIEGNIRQGRPTPVISRMGDSSAVKAFWDLFGKTRTHEFPDGTVEREQYLEFDADKLLTLGNDAAFDWKSPNPFTGDTETLLGLMFYLYVQHSEIPEWALGNAIASSRASAETQIEPFTKFITKKRGMAEDWVLEVMRVVMAYMAVSGDIDTSFINATDEDLRVVWPNPNRKDDALILQSLMFLRGEGLISDEETLVQAPIEIENPSEALEKARQEAEEKREAFDRQGIDQALRDALERDEDADDEPEGDDEPAPETVGSNGHSPQAVMAA